MKIIRFIRYFNSPLQGTICGFNSRGFVTAEGRDRVYVKIDPSEEGAEQLNKAFGDMFPVYRRSIWYIEKDYDRSLQ